MSDNSVPKCANPSCQSPNHCAGSGQYFRLEILTARDADSPASAVNTASQLGNANPQRRTRPRLRVEDYWLCSHCAELYTLSYDHENHKVQGVKRQRLLEDPEPLLELAGIFRPEN